MEIPSPKKNGTADMALMIYRVNIETIPDLDDSRDDEYRGDDIKYEISLAHYIVDITR